MSKIHPTAIVEEGAKLGADVEIGAQTVIGPNVSIGDKTTVMAHVVIDGHTQIGKECKIFPFACLGTETQDLKYKGAETKVIIGDRTTLREYVTVNSSTEEGNETRVGSDCHIMAYCHVAHECIVGDGVIMSNCSQLAGHVTVEDQAIVGGMVGVHQFVRIGKMAFVGGFSRIAQDIAPFLIVEGNPAAVRGINSIGLKRKGMSEDVRRSLKEACRMLSREGLSTKQAIEKMKQELDSCEELDHFVAFIETSERGIVK